jgi:hypothetical protein
MKQYIKVTLWTFFESVLLATFDINSAVLSINKYASIESQICPANKKQGPAALTNKKQGNLDQIHADNIAKRSGDCIYRKKYKNNFFQENLKNLNC